MLKIFEDAFRRVSIASITALAIGLSPSLWGNQLPTGLGKLNCVGMRSKDEKSEIILVYYRTSEFDELLFKRHSTVEGLTERPPAVLGFLRTPEANSVLVGEQEGSRVYLRLDSSETTSKLSKELWDRKELEAYEDPYVKSQVISLAEPSPHFGSLEIRGLSATIPESGWKLVDGCREKISVQGWQTVAEVNEGAQDDVLWIRVSPVSQDSKLNIAGHFLVTQDVNSRLLTERHSNQWDRVNRFFDLAAELQKSGVHLWPEEDLSKSNTKIQPLIKKYFPERVSKLDSASEYRALAIELFGSYRSSISLNCPGLSASYAVGGLALGDGELFAYRYANRLRLEKPFVPHHHALWIGSSQIDSGVLTLKFPRPGGTTFDLKISEMKLMDFAALQTQSSHPQK